jgi:hypothetical protein
MFQYLKQERALQQLQTKLQIERLEDEEKQRINDDDTISRGLPIMLSGMFTFPTWRVPCMKPGLKITPES